VRQVRDGLDGIRALVPGVRLEPLALLAGSSRSRVRRVRADSRTLIVKEFTGSGEGWARESAALSVLPAEVRAPRLIAAGADPPTVVMSDVGTGASVADALLGPDPVAAADAVAQWATSIGVLHRATTGSREAFRDALDARAGGLPVADSTMSADLHDAAAIIARQCAGLGVDVPAGAFEELRAMGTRLCDAGDAALTPADACPDNNVRTDDGLVLIDFEGAQWRHVAWDVAYLVVPWPSCWCSWRIPADVVERAIDAYRAAFALPDVDAAGFRRDVETAATGWAFVSAAWLLPRALPDDQAPVKPGRPVPNPRAVLLHRLDQARRSADGPALAEFAARLHHTLSARWGDTALQYAPAFHQP
jgi:hypothetical protein